MVHPDLATKEILAQVEDRIKILTKELAELEQIRLIHLRNLHGAREFTVSFCIDALSFLKTGTAREVLAWLVQNKGFPIPVERKYIMNLYAFMRRHPDLFECFFEKSPDRVYVWRIRPGECQNGSDI